MHISHQQPRLSRSIRLQDLIKFSVMKESTKATAQKVAPKEHKPMSGCATDKTKAKAGTKKPGK